MKQLGMYCNLRPPDAASVVLRLNYEVHMPSLNSDLKRFTAHTKVTLYSVTLTFYPLTLKICSVSGCDVIKLCTSDVKSWSWSWS